ncbi:MAG: DUF2834 domain-containing protein [Solirubrobacteraceae bacterium]|nr:DUF2834 domain-containing protein [Solirubrobacteraceae bacterium]
MTQQLPPSTLERWLRWVAVVGFVVPNAVVVTYFVRHGLAIGDYFEAWVGTLPSTQLIVDLVICSLGFLTWAAVDARRHGVDNWWWALPATFLVGLCFAIPLYLAIREAARRTRPISVDAAGTGASLS